MTSPNLELLKTTNVPPPPPLESSLSFARKQLSHSQSLVNYPRKVKSNKIPSQASESRRANLVQFIMNPIIATKTTISD